MTAFVELFLDQGTTFTNTLNLTDDVTNASLNIFGYSVSSQLRRSYYSQNASANIVCTITNAANGEIELSLDAANTSNLKPGRYVFDVKAVDNNNITSRLLEGIITVTPSVTRG